jgi:hypothetical protein
LIGFFAVAILSYVLGSGKVMWDKIYGAICAYLLLGYAWTFAYSWSLRYSRSRSRH